MISSQLRMRRFENGTKDPKMIAAMLDMITTVHIGCFDEEYPYVVPMSFGYEIKDNKLLVYVHCAREGHKIDLWKKNPHVFLTFDAFSNHPDKLYRGCMHDFRCVMALGTISEVVRNHSQGQHGTAVQAILRHNGRRGNQFSVPHYMWMAVYVITCDWENVSGKFENPIDDVAEVPFPDVYNIPENNTPYDCSYFYHRKQYSAIDSGWQPVFEPLHSECKETLFPSITVDLTLAWQPKEGNEDMDVDLSALLLNGEGRVRRRYDMVFYNQPLDMSHAICHLGDDILQAKRGSETLRLSLDRLPEQVDSVLIDLAVFGAENGQKGLEALKTLTVSATVGGGEPLPSFDLDTSLLSGPAATVLKLSREGSGWKLEQQVRLLDSWKVLDHANQHGLAKWKE